MSINLKNNSWEDFGEKEPQCNHFMVWNIQGGLFYYRCDKCNYIDGNKTLNHFLDSHHFRIIDMPVDFENEARKISRDQIFRAGQMNILLRIKEILKNK